MIRLLRFLLTGDWHLHKWVILEKGSIRDDRENVVARFFNLRCEVCGDVVCRNLK